MSALSYVFAFVVMLGVLIFVHELGHFLMARWCGVRVLKFSLGFGPPIGIGRFRLAWTRGHTEYVVGSLPLGGFVKMLGENPGEEAEEPAPAPADPAETLQARPLWQKLAIVFAGPAMNLAFAVVLFSLMLFLGLQTRDAVIGTVEASSPAAAAGLEPGDRILALDGAPVRWWSDVADFVRSHAGAEVEATYARGGARATTRLAVGERPGFDEFGTVKSVGWAGFDHARLRAMLGIPGAGSAAFAAELRSGDVVRAVAGAPVEDWAGFARAYAAAPTAAPVEIEVERGPEREAVRARVPALGDVAALGVIPATVLVAAVSPDSPASRAGLEPGDLILAVDGEPMGSFMAFSDRVKTSGGRTLELLVARDAALQRIPVTPEIAPLDMGLGVEDHYLVGISSQPTTLPGSMGLDRERNPLAALPRAAVMTWEMAVTIVRGVAKLATGEVSSRQIAGPIGIAQIAGSALLLGWETYLQVMIFISVNLGILNLLPIPILDGGQAVVFAIEGIKRAPLSVRTRENFQKLGLTVLVLLMGLAFWNDLSRHWAEVLDWLRRGTGL